MFSKLQPEVERIQKKYKDDRAVQTQELLKLYKEHKFNPFSSLLLLFVQIPILIALYKVFLQGVKGTDFSLLYPWVSNPGSLNPRFLGLVDLTAAVPVLVIAAGMAQFFQSRMLMPKSAPKNPGSFQTMFSRQMMWMGPFITVAVLWSLPSVIAIFWFLTTLISIGRCLISLQRDFTAHGPKALKPLTQAQVAQLVGRHASTVSRAIAGKTIDTPYGIFRLEQLFPSGVPQAAGSATTNVSDATIKAEIQRLIAEEEDARQPFSDEALARRLTR
jgi:YidC/Oxa1 family membrane protein insertase